MSLPVRAAEIIIREARKDFDSIQRDIADWNDMADKCQRQGYRPKYCIHGTYAWADYDNICAGCEDGIYPQDTTYMDVLKATLNEYRHVQERFKSSHDDIYAMQAAMNRMGLSSELIADTIMKTVDEYLGRFAH